MTVAVLSGNSLKCGDCFNGLTDPAVPGLPCGTGLARRLAAVPIPFAMQVAMLTVEEAMGCGEDQNRGFRSFCDARSMCNTIYLSCFVSELCAITHPDRYLASYYRGHR